jgi:hypothetical protein
LFIRAVREHVMGTPPSAELLALGGDFLVRAAHNDWLSPDGCVASDGELETLFTRRWAELTLLRDEPQFKPSLGELRRYFRFLLLHPERGDPSEAPARERARMRLRYVETLAHHDTEYPLALARGSLLAELGAMPDSARTLSGYLARPSSLEWNLRARNYLLFVAAGRGGDADELAPLHGP